MAKQTEEAASSSKESKSGWNCREFFVIVALIAVVVLFMTQSADLSNSNFKQLHNDDFDDWINKQEYALVEFYVRKTKKKKLTNEKKN